ncbi:MAG: PepSY-like domain-containing protein [Bacteroidales bacterium]|nr:PepSY-like domain-containing protein [Bacteroidales bacterium]
MKKLLMMMACLFALNAAIYAGDDKPIQVNQLPGNSQQFIQKHFNGIEISYAKVDNDLLDKSYEVIFVNGNKVEFSKNGEWKDVSCKFSQVPNAIVPQQILNFVTKNHQNQKIVKIDRDTRDYEVELNNGLEIKFDLKYNVIGYDD